MACACMVCEVRSEIKRIMDACVCAEKCDSWLSLAREIVRDADEYGAQAPWRYELMAKQLIKEKK